MIREVVSHLDNSLSSGLACSTDICLVENTWKITKLKADHIAKNQYFIHSSLFTSFYVSGPGDQLGELLSSKVPWVQYISQNAKLIIEKKEFLFF